MDSQTIQHIALMLPALLLSLCVHEYAHAWAATRLGDSTPERQGRLTLSPLSHVDPIGSLLFPILLIVTMGSVFGWAKPVQFQPNNFTRKVSMRTGAALTAAAGPMSNVLLALLTALVVRAAVALGFTPQADGSPRMVFQFLETMFVLNVVLAVFNLLPLPPLDGSYLLPRSMDEIKEKLSRYSFILLFLLFFIPLPGIGTVGGLLLGPFKDALASAVQWVAFLGA